MEKMALPNDKYGSPGIIIAERGGSSHCLAVTVDTSRKTSAATPTVIGEMMGKTK